MKQFRFAEIIIHDAPKIKSIEIGSGWNYNYAPPYCQGVNSFAVFMSTSAKYSSFDKIPHNNTALCDFANTVKSYFGGAETQDSYTTPYKTVNLELTDDAKVSRAVSGSSKGFEYLYAVTTVNSQEIDGVKTFLQPPKSSQAPAEDNDLANKKYVDDELAKLVARIAALEAAKP